MDEYLKTFLTVLITVLVGSVIAGTGFLLKRKFFGGKKVEQSSLLNQAADTDGKKAATEKAQIETAKLAADIKTLAMTGEVQSATAFAKQIQELLNFAQQQGEKHNREQTENLLLIGNLRIELENARQTILDLNEAMKKQKIISDYEQDKLIRLQGIYADTVRELNELKDQYKIIMRERNEFETQSGERQKKYDDLKMEMDNLTEEVRRLKGIMSDHQIPAH